MVLAVSFEEADDCLASKTATDSLTWHPSAVHWVLLNHAHTNMSPGNTAGCIGTPNAEKGDAETLSPAIENAGKSARGVVGSASSDVGLATTVDPMSGPAVV